MCGGVAFVTEDTSYHTAFSMANACCSSAKKYAKMEHNLQDGLAGNWIDFQVFDNPNSQELETLRDRSYTTLEQISLLNRPYCLVPGREDENISFRALVRRIRAIVGLSLDPQDETLLRQSFLVGKDEFREFILRMQAQGVDLVSLLGAPLYRDDDRQWHATWFDAVELADFIAPNMADLLEI